jgi:hypothetical protein
MICFMQVQKEGVIKFKDEAHSEEIHGQREANDNVEATLKMAAEEDQMMMQMKNTKR